MKEAAFIKKTISEVPFDQVLHEFFSNNTPDSVYLITFSIFQCWVLNACKIKAGIPDEDVALLIDQLNSLVAAAYILHQGNRVQATLQKGIKND
ncbi:MAG TPA: hypothetical protein VHA52_07075 [Candidatus Babeliaceae bacterium]|nr:hypothetical protein [Candidatus Babeliaceae bacterium]